MFSAELRSLLVEILTSWQVLVVTFVVILYIFLINYVARIHQKRPRKAALPKSKKKKAEKNEGPVVAASDELGLEDQPPEKAE